MHAFNVARVHKQTQFFCLSKTKAVYPPKLRAIQMKPDKFNNIYNGYCILYFGPV